MASKSFLAFLAALLLLPCTFSYGQTLAEAKVIIKELVDSIELMDSMLRIQQEQLNAKEQLLLEVSSELTTLKSELMQLQDSNTNLMELNLTLKAQYAAEQKRVEKLRSSLIERQTERDIIIGIVSVIALGWGIDRAFIR